MSCRTIDGSGHQQMRRPHSSRRRATGRALTALLPMAPYSDIERIREMAHAAKFRDLPVSIAVWLAAIAHIRHEHTEYDSLLAEGYGQEAARHYTMDAINECLTRWRATRLLEEDELGHDERIGNAPPV